MRLVNLSRHPRAAVARVIREAARLARCQKYLGDVEFLVSSDTRKRDYGLTSRQERGFLVTVELGTQPYPVRQRLNPHTPEVVLRSWEDSLFVVVAHELAHVRQFETVGVTSANLLECEVEAETRAVRSLEFRRAFA